MVNSRLRLFAVECRPKGDEQAHRFFVPAQSPDEAVTKAVTSAREAHSQQSEVTDPFQDNTDLEVRVGTFERDASIEIEFGDWAPFRQ
jgi:hypothetical protein